MNHDSIVESCGSNRGSVPGGHEPKNFQIKNSFQILGADEEKIEKSFDFSQDLRIKKIYFIQKVASSIAWT